MVLFKVSDKIDECLVRAAEARECANSATDLCHKADLLNMEFRWLRLVESYRFVEQVDHFLEDAHARRNGSPLSELLAVLVHAAIEQTGRKARAAFYLADHDGRALHHVTGMTPAYARHVDGFAISPESLACGLAAATRRAVITPDVVEEPRWKPWLWLAEQFDYRACWSFPIETTTGKIVGTFAMYYREPTEAKPHELDLVSLLTRTAATIISRRV